MKLRFIDTGNITDKHLGRRGFLRKIYEMRLEVHVRVMIYDNYFLKPTKNVNKEYETKILDQQIKGDEKDNSSNIESEGGKDGIHKRRNHSKAFRKIRG